MSDALVSEVMVKNSVKDLQKSIVELNEENKKLQKTNVKS
jgi:hypothetical protein